MTTNWDFSSQKNKDKKCPTSEGTINSLVHKIRLHTVDEGKERLNPSREKK